MNLSLIFSQIGLSQKIAQDVMLFLVVAFFSFVFAMLVGRYKLITVLVNVYVSFALLSVFPAKLFPDYSTQLILFFGAIAILTFFSRRMFDLPISGSGKDFLWRVFVMSFLEIALMMSVAFSIMSKKTALSYISSNAYNYLVSENAMIFWMLAPLVFMFIIHKKISR